MGITLLKLLLAHLLGDFFLQPDSWVLDKEKKKYKSKKLYWHVLIHIGLIFLIFFSLKIWKIAIIVGFSHLLIDVLKLIYQRAKVKRRWFFIDQLLHVLVIVACWIYMDRPQIDFEFLQNQKFWIFMVGAAVLTSPTAVLIKMLITKWIPNTDGKIVTSLQDAGKFIGMLERLLIFLFVCTRHFEAVGFLLAAKSIFRFGDLKEAHDIKLTEYVLIGTLLSFGIALSVAMMVMSLF
jgi:magnesium-transporting ATPase (P-type)